MVQILTLGVMVMYDNVEFKKIILESKTEYSTKYDNIMLFVCHAKILHKHCLQFLLGVEMAPRQTENNAYAKQTKSIMVCYGILWSSRLSLNGHLYKTDT